MCWNLAATVAMVGAGSVATAATAIKHDAPAIPVTLGYFTLMEALQAAGYLVIDRCGSPLNQSITFLSLLHIAFQPFFVNAFALELVPAPVRARARLAAHGVCAVSTVVMLMQLYPFDWAGVCRPGSLLCGRALCTVSGDWHIAWTVPYNGLLDPIGRAIGVKMAFPTYVLAAFAVPLFYGAWRFVLFHAVAGPLLALLLTGNQNEAPAIWCLFSIGIILIAISPPIRRRIEWRLAAV
jgi:hypothetical protein